MQIKPRMRYDFIFPPTRKAVVKKWKKIDGKDVEKWAQKPIRAGIPEVA